MSDARQVLTALAVMAIVALGVGLVRWAWPPDIGE